jgi:quinoprotein glucose dehydrogenase
MFGKCARWAGIFASWIVLGCGGQGGASPSGFLVMTVLESGLSTVWDIEAVSETRLYIVERPGRVRLMVNEVLQPAPYATISVATGQQAGLFDMALSPDYATDAKVFLSYAVADAEGTKLRVARYRDTGTTLEFEQTLFEGPSVDDSTHYGGRMAIGPDDKLYIAHGERHDTAAAQSLASVKGKILRLNLDGTAPADNPFVGVAGALPEIWSLGHRNPQGLAFHPLTGALVSSEHGPSDYDAPRGYDEINVIERGANYGWPQIWGGMTQTGMRAPNYYWVPPTAPGGIAVWEDQLIVPLLWGEGIAILRPSGASWVEERVARWGRGRVRSVTVTPGGTIYVGTSNGQDGSPVDGIYRLKRN